MAEQEQANSMTSLELKPVTGEQVFQERNEESFLKKASVSEFEILVNLSSDCVHLTQITITVVLSFSSS